MSPAAASNSGQPIAAGKAADLVHKGGVMTCLAPVLLALADEVIE